MASSGVSLAFAESQTRLKHWACPYLLQACAQHRMGTHCLQGGFMKRRAVVVQEALLLRAPCVWHVGWIIMAREKKNNPKVKLRKYASSLIFQSINIKHTVGASRLVQWLRAHLPVQGSGKASRAAGQRACVHRIREGPTCCGATSRVHRIWEGPTCRGATSRVHRIREGPTCHRATSLCAPHPGRPHVLRSDKPVCPAAVGPVCSSPELSS